jgi:hypothetical protein
VRMPFAVSWTGALRITQAGTYQFEARGSGPYTVWLDHAELLAAHEVIPDEPAITNTTRDLAEGLHPFSAHWDSSKPAHTFRRLFQVFWIPPGGARELIPPANFVRTEGP